MTKELEYFSRNMDTVLSSLLRRNGCQCRPYIDPMPETCPSCNGSGSEPASGFMPRAAVCLQCEGSGQVYECQLCHDLVAEVEEGLCGECRDENQEGE